MTLRLVAFNFFARELNNINFWIAGPLRNFPGVLRIFRLKGNQLHQIPPPPTPPNLLGREVVALWGSVVELSKTPMQAPDHVRTTSNTISFTSPRKLDTHSGYINTRWNKVICRCYSCDGHRQWVNEVWTDLGWKPKKDKGPTYVPGHPTTYVG